MSCCGSKRAQWARQQSGAAQPASVPDDDQRGARPRPPRTFEYSGTGELTLRGAVSGTIYHFDRRSARVEVMYEDAFAMMAEHDLRLTGRR